MKLVIISHAYNGDLYLPVLNSMAARRDVDLTLICPSSYHGETADWETSLFQRVRVPIRFGSRQGAFLYHAVALANSLDRLKPDVILHEQEVYAVGAAQIAKYATKRSIPLAVFVWENVDRSLSLPRRLVRDFVLRNSSAIIAGSTAALVVHRNWGFKGPTRIIPQMGVEVSSAPPFGRRGGATLKVCFVGRLHSSKGIDCLLRAIAILHHRNVPVRCTVAGAGAELGNLNDLAFSLGIETLVHFPGQLSGDDVHHLLRTNDVLVLPSRRTRVWEEQFGRALAESMAEGAVTVGSRTGAIPEVIGFDDLIFEEEDNDGLAGILERLLADEEFFLTRQRCLWARVRDNYGNDTLAARRIGFLQEILELTSSGKTTRSVTI